MGKNKKKRKSNFGIMDSGRNITKRNSLEEGEAEKEEDTDDMGVEEILESGRSIIERNDLEKQESVEEEDTDIIDLEEMLKSGRNIAGRNDLEEGEAEKEEDTDDMGVEEILESGRSIAERNDLEKGETEEEEDTGIINLEEMLKSGRNIAGRNDLEEGETEEEEDTDIINLEEMLESGRNIAGRNDLEEGEAEEEEDTDTISPEEILKAGESAAMERKNTPNINKSSMIVPVYKKNKEKTEERLPVVPVVRRGKEKKIDKKQEKKMEKNSFLDKDTEFNSYTFAKRILSKYRIWHLDLSDWTLWIWNGCFYEPLNDNKLEALIYSELPEEFKSSLKSCKKSIQDTMEFIKRECAPSPIQSKKSGKPGKSYKTFQREDMKKVYNRVVLKKGVYDVVTGELLPFDEKLPYYYGINAKYISGESLDTPFFDKLLRDATGGDKDTIQMIHWAIGMLLLPNKCKKFIVAGNASNSGKSILFGQFLDSLFDANRISRVDSSKLGGRFALGDCEDKLLVSCLDIDENVLSSKVVGVIKRATGEEKISSEAKYKVSKETIVRFKFVFATNLGFTSSRYDSGLVNRILALPFIKETAEENQIANLAEELQKERDKIVTKILREMKEVIKGDGNIVIPESDLSKQMKASWTTVNSFFEEFCENLVKVTGNEEDYISWEDLYEFYRKYFFQKAKSSDGRYEILSKQAFIKSFTNKVEIGYGGQVEQVRRRKFGNQEYPNAVRRLIGIKVKI